MTVTKKIAGKKYSWDKHQPLIWKTEKGNVVTSKLILDKLRANPKPKNKTMNTRIEKLWVLARDARPLTDDEEGFDRQITAECKFFDAIPEITVSEEWKKIQEFNPTKNELITSAMELVEKRWNVITRFQPNGRPSFSITDKCITIWQYDMEQLGINFHWDDDPADIVITQRTVENNLETFEHVAIFSGEESKAVTEVLEHFGSKIWQDDICVMPVDFESFKASRKKMTVAEASQMKYLEDIIETYEDADITLNHDDTVYIYMDNFAIVEHFGGQLSTETFNGIVTVSASDKPESLEGGIFAHCLTEGLFKMENPISLQRTGRR
tara:strand:- start:738 stop:1709 length:972 start_codon:yes stop_codon:yes gene_type:complete